MAMVFIPPTMRDATNGDEKVSVHAANIGQLIRELDQVYPGMADRLCEDGRIRGEIAVAVDGEITEIGMFATVEENSEVHFLPAISGGSGT
jgi:molybdopterin synthase sulfur carrier subunit